MRLISKTLNKVVIEIHIKEVEKSGFDFIWDKIRNVYKISDYDIFTIERDKDNLLIFVELTVKNKKN